MDQYVNFFISHWELALLFVLSFFWVILMEMNSRRNSAWEVQPQDAISLINRQSALLFDLRKAEAFVQGHIVGAKQVSFNPEKDDPKTSLKISPKTTCLFICYKGQSSGKVVQSLRAKGYDSTFSLSGGIAAWEKESLPIVKGK